jgi:multisubunit Na+/H+ antiporter MnhE subunit
LIVRFLATWLALFVGWLALVGTLELAELAAGVVAATVALVAAEAVRSQGLLHPAVNALAISFAVGPLGAAPVLVAAGR